MKDLAQHVQEANKLNDPLSLLPQFSVFEGKNLKCKLKTVRATDLDDATKKWLFDLFKTNMMALYEVSKTGWNERKKYREIFDSSAYFLIASDIDDDAKLYGYSNFRFDMDFDDEVLYCYELQIDQNVHKNGLGKYMMKVLELLALKTGMSKVMLTCFKHNTSAQIFYKEKLKFTLDETDMNDDITQDLDYEILSRVIPKKKLQ